MIANDYTDVTAVVVVMISASAIWTIRWMAKVTTVVLKIEHLSSININEIESDLMDFETKNSYYLHIYFFRSFSSALAF
jgi:hypothetical protein